VDFKDSVISADSHYIVNMITYQIAAKSDISSGMSYWWKNNLPDPFFSGQFCPEIFWI